MTACEIKKKILSLQTPAIVLGNGLNLEAKKENGKNSPIEEWKELILDIAQKTKLGYSPHLFDSKYVSYPEMFDWILLKRKEKFSSDFKIKREISEKLSKWKPSSGIHGQLVSFCEDSGNGIARGEGIPILTTNYDMLLLPSCDYERWGNGFKEAEDNGKTVKRIELLRPKSINKINVFYFLSSYYSPFDLKPSSDFLHTFAIWHMHGTIVYPNSLRVGVHDYALLMARLRINLPKYDKNTHQLKNLWKGLGTWLEIFFKANLVFTGLSFQSQETCLRWLLIERARYYKIGELGDPPQSIFIQTSYDLGKHDEHEADFFSSLGVEVLNLDEQNKLSDVFKVQK